MSDQVPQIRSFDQAAIGVRTVTVAIRALEEALGKAGDQRADAEAVYRQVFATKLREHRGNGSTVAEAEAYAKADTAVHARARDRAELKIRELLEALEDRRGERHSLHRLMDYAMSTAPGPEGPR